MFIHIFNGVVYGALLVVIIIGGIYSGLFTATLSPSL